jgi:hypothetical protein
MKNSEKGASKPSTIDQGFAERTGVLQSLRNQFPNVIDKMIQLLIAANEDCENHLHEFAFELDGIAYLYGRRHNSPVIKYVHPDTRMHPDYVANQRERQEKLEKAALCLNGLALDLCQLDLYHLRKFLSSYKTPTGRTKYDGPMEAIGEIDFATRVIAACHEAYSSIAFEAPVKRGRRPLPYVDATRELINLWQRYAGQKVPISKTHENSVTHARQITTNAGEFIRLGISLIDPDVTDAKVVTSINNALSKSS